MSLFDWKSRTVGSNEPRVVRERLEHPIKLLVLFFGLWCIWAFVGFRVSFFRMNDDYFWHGYWLLVFISFWKFIKGIVIFLRDSEDWFLIKLYLREDMCFGTN